MLLFTILSLFVTPVLGNFSLFQEQLTTHNRIYSSLEEMNYRYNVFQQNMDTIQSHNQAHSIGQTTFTLGLNQFFDRTGPEFMEWIQFDSSGCTSKSESPSLPPAVISVDWRQKGIVTPPKNQENCGSCWAFSTTGALEGAYALRFGELVSFSEQQLVDCSTENNGCNGGLMPIADRYVQQYGIESESSYPYNATQGVCSYNPRKVVTHISSQVNITTDDVDTLKRAVSHVGPISVAIQVNMCWQFYSGGIFNATGTYGPTTCTGSVCSSDVQDLNHGVLLVGLGFEPSGTDSCSEVGGCSYFLIKNSWGSVWGESGYIKMQDDGTNLCGIATCASYPII